MASNEIPYYRPLTDQEAQGVAGLRQKLASSEFPEAQKDTARLIKFLRARDYDLEKAYEQLINCLKWRREFKPEQIKEEDIKNQLSSGKVFWLPIKDKQGRPVMVFFGGLHDPNCNLEELKKYVVYIIESEYSKATPGSDWQYLLIYDRVGFTRSNFDKDGLRDVTVMLSNYYPEILGEVLIANTNWLFWIIFEIVKIFFDAKTKQKMKILGNDIKSDLLKYFDEDSLWSFYGGKFKWQFQITNYLKLAGVPEEKPSEEEAQKTKQLAEDFSKQQ